MLEYNISVKFVKTKLKLCTSSLIELYLDIVLVSTEVGSEF